ncbi:MAG: trypsin-like peptidase domain-containing protein [Simkaniaceae bacterium]|nr:trypsin-like peptidase domain-containing protein [Candidatus Sacchlamyda saccharinae]
MKIYTLLLSLFLFFQPLSAISETVEKVSPSVVFIIGEYNAFEASYPDPWFFQEPLRPFYEWMWPSRHFQGSGFIVSEDGYVVTNEHVVDGMTDLLVVMQTGEKRIRKAHVVGKDRRSDIAVIKLENSEDEIFPTLTFGDSRNANIGDPVFVIGNPIDSLLESTVTSGIVSAKDRNGKGMQDIEGYIQTDATINGGNSGGPLFDSKGEVIGVVAMIYNHFWGYEGIGLTIPAHFAERIAKQIIENKKVTRGYFGARVDFSRESAFGRYHFDAHDGAIIEDVRNNSPAEKAGLQVGDKILSIDGISIDSAYCFINEIQCYPAHSKIHLTVERDYEVLEIPVTLDYDVLN